MVIYWQGSQSTSWWLTSGCRKAPADVRIASLLEMINFKRSWVQQRKAAFCLPKGWHRTRGVIQTSGRCSLGFIYGPYWSLKSFCSKKSLVDSSFKPPILNSRTLPVVCQNMEQPKRRRGWVIGWLKKNRYFEVKPTDIPNINPHHTSLVNHPTTARNKNSEIWRAWLLCTTSCFYGCGLYRKWRKSSLVLLCISTLISSWRGDWVKLNRWWSGGCFPKKKWSNHNCDWLATSQLQSQGFDWLATSQLQSQDCDWFW